MDQRPLVQWTFLQYKKSNRNMPTPQQCFLHSTTQVGSKILIFGGCDFYGNALNQMFVYDAVNYVWSAPEDASDFQEDHPGARYGHTATLVEMHPPKILIWGGMVGDGTFEFDAPSGFSPDGVEEPSSPATDNSRKFMSWRRKGKQNNFIETTEDSVYFLQLHSEHWKWSKPLVRGAKSVKPPSRAEHSACKTSTNEITIFGGWSDGPLNDLWSFNFVDMEWKELSTSGIQPRPRFRHTAEVIGSKMYIFGGSETNDDIADGSKLLNVHVLCLATLQWSHPTLSGVNPFPRSGHSSAVVGANTVAIFGGKRNSEIFLNDLILIDVTTFKTTVVNAVASLLPTPIANATMNCVGNSCVVFGGTDVFGNCFNDIRYVEVGYYLSKDDITVSEGASSDYCFKVIIIGDASVGKSAILTRFAENVFLDNYTSTIGIDYNSRMIRVDGSICKLEIWDTAGQERFSTITANYYRGAQGVMLVYDVSSRESFEHVRKWFERAKQLGGEELIAILVGNKCDIGAELMDDYSTVKRQVTYEEGLALANELAISFLETSALNGSNVDTAFVNMTSNIKASVDKRGVIGIKAKNMKNTGSVRVARTDAKSLSAKCSCN